MADDTWVVSTKPSERFSFYTRANVGEVFPDPVAPSSFSYFFQNEEGPGLGERGFRDAFVRLGAFSEDEYDPDEPQFLGIFNGYCYLNASMMRLLGHRAPGMVAEDIDAAFFGDAPGVPPYVEMPGDERPDLTEKIGEVFGWALSIDELADVARDEEMVNQLRADRPKITSLTDRELFERTRSLYLELFGPLFTQHIYISMLATLPVGILTAICAAVGRPEAALKLLSGLGDVESAAPSSAMWDLGRMISESEALTGVFDAGVSGIEQRLRGPDSTEFGVFCAAFDDFLVRYGSRGPNEWEIRCPTWETDPEIALAAIDRMRLAEADAAPGLRNSERAREREQLAAEISSMIEGDAEAHGQFTAALKAAGVFTPGRERTKTNCVKLLQEVRVAARELGGRWVSRGFYDEPEDGSFLTMAQQAAELDSPGSHLGYIAETKKRFTELDGLEEPFLFVGEQPTPDTWPERDATAVTPATVGDVLQGVSGCTGRAVGRARVVLDSLSPDNLEPGDILVAPITDPSWTPLFVPAAAVVVNVGAPLSHAVIVSRELGIPCVVSVADATRVIPEGALIEVDGDTGTVTILEA